eukprot:2936975-Rhodomonas_salina.1
MVLHDLHRFLNHAGKHAQSQTGWVKTNPAAAFPAAAAGQTGQSGQSAEQPTTAESAAEAAAAAAGEIQGVTGE